MRHSIDEYISNGCKYYFIFRDLRHILSLTVASYVLEILIHLITRSNYEATALITMTHREPPLLSRIHFHSLPRTRKILNTTQFFYSRWASFPRWEFTYDDLYLLLLSFFLNLSFNWLPYHHHRWQCKPFDLANLLVDRCAVFVPL